MSWNLSIEVTVRTQEMIARLVFLSPTGTMKQASLGWLGNLSSQTGTYSRWLRFWLCSAAELAAARLARSPALAYLLVEVLGLHQDQEQWVSWAAPLAVQALLSSVPYPSSHAWLKVSTSSPS